MLKTVISVTEAARNFAECVNRAHYQNVTFVLVKNGSPVARIAPYGGKNCDGSRLAEAIQKSPLSDEDANAWWQDALAARKNRRAPADKWYEEAP
jgi:antitoxin (DNA-binding transcriptional repressor) of toxin-antitoxin stability system